MYLFSPESNINSNSKNGGLNTLWKQWVEKVKDFFQELKAKQTDKKLVQSILSGKGMRKY
jgi:hypothetical protein